MRKFNAIALVILWLLMVVIVIYLLGAWVMLRWDYINLISSDNRGAMAGAFFLLCLCTFWLPGVIYEGVYDS